MYANCSRDETLLAEALRHPDRDDGSAAKGTRYALDGAVHVNAARALAAGDALPMRRCPAGCEFSREVSAP